MESGESGFRRERDTFAECPFSFEPLLSFFFSASCRVRALCLQWPGTGVGFCPPPFEVRHGFPSPLADASFSYGRSLQGH